MEHSQTTIQVAIRNFANREIMFFLEPWGEEFQMGANDEFVLIGHGPVKNSGFWIDYNESSIVVTSWTGSTVQVFFRDK